MSKNKSNNASVFKTPEGRQQILELYEGILSQFDFEYKEHYVETKYGSTYVIESGSTDLRPLFLFHGSSSNSASWFADIGRLNKEFRVIAVDLIGDAGHSAENRLDMKSDDYAHWIRELFEGLGIERASVMGNSLGAWMCLKTASVYPEMIEKVVVIAASGIAPVRLSFVLQLILFSLRGKNGAEAITRMVYGEDEIPQEVLDFMDVITKNYLPYSGEVPVLTDSQLARINMPLLYIAGKDDKLTNVPKCVKRLERLLPNVSIYVIKNHGHVVYDVLDQVIPFLKK